MSGFTVHRGVLGDGHDRQVRLGMVLQPEGLLAREALSEGWDKQGHDQRPAVHR